MGSRIEDDCVAKKKANPYDAIGKRYGRLTVIEIAGKGSHNRTLMKCKCDCGNEKVVPFGNLNTGRSNSCGCLERENYERLGNLNKTHGESKTRLYKEWKGMYTRCYNPNRHTYSNYGGRGIKVSEQWKTFEEFKKWALSNGYSDNLSIDRIDVNGDYEPNNCRWITMKEQSLNKRNTIYVTYQGEKKPLKIWAKELNISYWTLKGRHTKGWTDREIIEGRRINGI